MNYYDNPGKYDERGIDYDLCAAIEYNDPGFSADDIERVLAVIEGENDGAAWHWLLEMKDGTFVYATGGCDYTGWDCQSWLNAERSKTPLGALDYVPDEQQDIFHNLYGQLSLKQKNPTWHEQTDQEFQGVLYGVDLTKVREQSAKAGIVALIQDKIAQDTPAQPYAPNYEVMKVNIIDAGFIVAGLLRERKWFCVRPEDPFEYAMFEIVVRYPDRESLFFFAGRAA